MENFDLLLAVQNGFTPGHEVDSELLKQTLKYKDVISMIEKVNFVRKLGLKKNV